MAIIRKTLKSTDTGGDKEIFFFFFENNFLVPQNELSDVNKTKIHIGNWQMFELSIINSKNFFHSRNHKSI